METIRQFTKEQLGKYVVLSDIQLIDIFIRKNYIKMFSNPNYGMLAKKGESIRKYLWQFKKDGLIKEEYRKKHPIENTGNNLNSEEIYYSLQEEGK